MTMDTIVSDLLEESIKLELNAGGLYRLYARLFQEDSGFWMRLSMEEMNHAALLKSARQFLKVGKFPAEVTFPDMEAIREANRLIVSRITVYAKEKPEMAEAYRFARRLETSAAEGHFQEIMSTRQDDRVLQIFQGLAGDDLDHARRIEALMKERGGL